MPLSCSMEHNNKWSYYSNHILLATSLEDALISSDKNYCSELIFHLFHNDTNNHTLVMHIHVSSFEISLLCQKVISIQPSLVRETPPKKPFGLLNNQLKKLYSVFTIVLGREDRCTQKTGVYMNSADTEYHRSTLFCPKERNNGMLTPRVLLLHTAFLLPNSNCDLHKCKQDLSNPNKCLTWERVKTFSLPNLWFY